MSALTGLYISNTYKQLIQIGSNNIGLTSSIQYLQDGAGITSALGISTTGVTVNATGITINSYVLTVAGTASITGTNTGDQDLSSYALKSDPLSQFAATTSLQLKNTISDETGSGALVFATSPTLVTPALGVPSSGTLSSCTGLPISTGVSGLASGIASFLAVPLSANLKTAVTDETGSGSLVFATSPTLITPAIGTPSSGTLTNCNGLPVVSGLNGTSPGITSFLQTASSLNLRAAMTDSTGTGVVVFATSPTLVTPLLGTPTSGTLTNCTGLPVGSITGLGTGVGTFLATPSSANLKAALTDETGSGAAVFATSPTLVTPILGTPTSGTLTNCTGYTEANLSISDITTNNVSITQHGFAPKAPNDGTKYLDGTGAYSVPVGSSGFVLQQIRQEISAVATGTTIMPYDDTIPQNTEGDQYMSVSITPSNVNNKLTIICSLTCSVNVSSTISVGLFQDSTAGALAATGAFMTTGTGLFTITLCHTMAAGTTSATTFKIRAGSSGAFTTTVNGQNASRIYGGVCSSYVQVTETTA